MKKTTKLTLTLLFTSVTTLTSFAQEFKDRFFIGLGYTAVLDYARLPATNQLDNIYMDGNKLVGSYKANSPNSISYFTYAAKFRYNIVDLNDDASIGIHVQPALGISVSYSNTSDQTSIGSLSIPIMVSYNTGNISTYKTSKNKGFGISLGVEYFNGGLINTSTNNDLSYTDALGNYQTYTQTSSNKTTALLVPSFELNYRYWNKSNKAKELSLLVSLGKKQSLETDTKTFQEINQTGSAKGAMHIRLMWTKYLNY